MDSSGGGLGKKAGAVRAAGPGRVTTTGKNAGCEKPPGVDPGVWEQRQNEKERYELQHAPWRVLLADGITDDTLHRIARFLPTAKDLLCLKLTNSRFAARVIVAPSQRNGASGSGSGGDAVHRGGGGAVVGGGCHSSIN